MGRRTDPRIREQAGAGGVSKQVEKGGIFVRDFFYVKLRLRGCGDTVVCQHFTFLGPAGRVVI